MLATIFEDQRPPPYLPHAADGAGEESERPGHEQQEIELIPQTCFV